MEGWHEAYKHAKNQNHVLHYFHVHATIRNVQYLKLWLCLFSLALGQQNHHPVRKRRYTWEAVSADEEQTPPSERGSRLVC